MKVHLPAGFAFVYMRDYRDAEDAIRALTGTTFSLAMHMREL